MLFDSLYCKGLLVHMYFLDEQCVLIFKTDNNKMLYLKIVCLKYIFAVCFLCVADILEQIRLLLPYFTVQVHTQSGSP